MTTIFCDNPGSCIESGGYTLDNNSWDTDCPDCGKDARERHWEAVEGGSINQYFTVRCGHCGHLSGNGLEDQEFEDVRCRFDKITVDFEILTECALDAAFQRLDTVCVSLIANLELERIGNTSA